MTSRNTFGSRDTLTVDGSPYRIYCVDRIDGVEGSTIESLPFSLKILLENLLRNEDDAFVKREDIQALATWDPRAGSQTPCSLSSGTIRRFCPRR